MVSGTVDQRLVRLSQGSMLDAAVLRDLEDSISSEEAIGPPAKLCQEVADLLAVTDVAFALIGGTEYRDSLCSSSSRAASLVRCEFHLGEGPCLTAVETAEPIGSEMPLTHDPRWPLFAEEALEADYRAVAAAPLSVQGRPYGAMALLSEDSMDAGTVTTAKIIADRIAVPLVRRLADGVAEARSEDLRYLHRAADMISTAMDSEFDAALDVLRAHAWSHGRDLGWICRQVARGELHFEQDSHS